MTETILNEHERTEIGKILGVMKGEVQVDLHVRKSQLIVPGRPPCETCPDAEQLITEVASINDKIKLTVHDDAEDPIPRYEFRSPAIKGTLRYLGLPAGYEFRVLLDLLIAAANGDSGLSSEAKEKVAMVSQPVMLQVFVTPG